VILIFYLLFRAYLHMERVDRDITQIVRVIALEQARGLPEEKAEERRDSPPTARQH
jgi:hypothetical protein